MFKVGLGLRVADREGRVVQGYMAEKRGGNV